MLRVPVGACPILRRSLVTSVLALALAGAVAIPASAQPPSLTVYTDPGLTDVLHCGGANTLEELFVVVRNVDFVFSAVDFEIVFPPSMTWLFDLPPDAAYTDGEIVTIGSSPTGIAIAWANCCMPDGSLGPTVVLRPVVLWTGTTCDCQSIVVNGYHALGKPSPSIIRASDFQEFPVVAINNVFINCATPVQPSTWGRVKSLYR